MLRILTLILFLTGLPSARASVVSQSPDFSEMLHEAGNLVRQGEWDRSEIVFLKVAESPLPTDRVKAYEGLSSLYKRLKLFKKAGHAEIKLKKEKSFLDKLVPKEDEYYKAYTPRWGETYAKIASREGVSLKWLQEANDRKTLVEGREIRVPVKRYHLVVSQKNKTMEWRRGSEVMKTYPIAVGRKGMETPHGKFKVVSKVRHPTWYWLKKEIPPESSKNLLGTRWLGLNHKGYGIHGTRDPGSIGNALSHGCVRMFNRDVEELFEWIPLGTSVTIHAN